MNLQFLDQLIDHYVEKLKSNPEISDLNIFEQKIPNQTWNPREFESKIKQNFQTKFGFSQAYISEHFALPQDYALFLAKGLAFSWGEGHAHISDEKSCLFYNLEECPKFHDLKAAQEQIATQEQNQAFWLHIGYAGDKHEYFLCCHQNHPHFGRVADYLDSWPYNDYPYIDGYVDSFVDFLALLALTWKY